MKKVVFVIFALFCICIGLYPILYFLIDRTFGLLSSKSDVLLSNTFWNIGFYAHILFGGLALLIGWIQFSEKLRRKKLKLHKLTGKIYTIAALISGLGSLYIAYFATGGMITMIGFMCLGVIWIYSTIRGYTSIIKGRIKEHQKFMIISYAACFAALTLRIWLPVLIAIFKDFIIAYKIVSWLCWVPNITVAFLIINKLKLNKV